MSIYDLGIRDPRVPIYLSHWLFCYIIIVIGLISCPGFVTKILRMFFSGGKTGDLGVILGSLLTFLTSRHL